MLHLRLRRLQPLDDPEVLVDERIRSLPLHVLQAELVARLR